MVYMQGTYHPVHPTYPPPWVHPASLLPATVAPLHARQNGCTALERDIAERTVSDTGVTVRRCYCPSLSVMRSSPVSLLGEKSRPWAHGREGWGLMLLMLACWEERDSWCAEVSLLSPVSLLVLTLGYSRLFLTFLTASHIPEKLSSQWETVVIPGLGYSEVRPDYSAFLFYSWRKVNIPDSHRYWQFLTDQGTGPPKPRLFGQLFPWG